MKIARKKLLDDLLSVLPAIDAGVGCLVFTGNEVVTYNEEVVCRKKVSLDVQGVVIAKPLVGLLQRFAEDEIEVFVKEGELRIKGDRRSAGIRMEKRAHFDVSDLENPKEWKPTGKKIAEALDLVAECASSDEAQFLLTCVRIGKTFVESCDGMQAIRYTTKLGFSSDALLRKAAASQVARIAPVECAETEDWVHFRNGGDLIFSCRRYQDNPAKLDDILKVDGVSVPVPAGIGEAARKASLFADDSSTKVLTVELSSGKMKVVGNGELGWYRETCAIEYDGKPVAFTIYPKLLIEVARRGQSMVLGDRKLKIEGPRWVWISVTGKPEDIA